MIITYFGGQYCKVAVGDTVVAINPISSESSWPTAKFGATIALVTLQHPDFNGIAAVTYGGKAPFVIDTPGEFEVGEVTVRGYAVPTTYAGKSHFNTIYQIAFEEMNLIFLGALGDAAVPPDVLAEFGEIDVLFIPIGGGDVLTTAAAAKLATKLEARVVIPLHFDQASLTEFLKETGTKLPESPSEKVTLKPKDVATMSGEVVVLTPKSS